MSVQFDRKYTVRVGLPGQEGAEWSDVQHVTFKVDMTANRGTNKATITLTNLSPQRIGALSEEGAHVTLVAGYKDEQGQIFSGSIAKQGVTTEFKPPTRITTILAGEGELEIQGTQIRDSFAPATTNRVIFQSIAAAMGLGLKDQEAIPLLTLSTGWAFAGRADAALDELAKSISAKWSIQAGQLQILTRDQTTAETAILVSPSTGLIGRAAPTKDGAKFDARLNAGYRPGRKVQLQSQDVTGLFKLITSTHTGDNRGPAWKSSCVARKIGGGS